MHGVGHGGHEFRGTLRIGGLAIAFEARGQRPAGGQLHAEPRATVGGAHLIERQDARVIEVGECIDLHLEALPHVVACVVEGQQHLDRHLAVRLLLPRAIDNAHTAAGQFLHDLMSGNLRESGGRRGDSGRVLRAVQHDPYAGGAEAVTRSVSGDRLTALLAGGWIHGVCDKWDRLLFS